ncbi:IS5 family transposase [Paralimibaculum aggregatum]|uniref:IS5 family transposase n=1 Tax=Paralimibaculum aggregatum TaxID=3036245 RepID=A0ABQ6LK09_9RHOB|nr:IS5 family transposase [Limibaculum sp. NKW23]GMG82565.1 IS5 family transposase [Limibaculum sp. NKW23]
MAGRQPGFWDVEQRLRELSAQGDPLEKLGATVDFEIFRADLDATLGPRDLSRGGRPPFDPVLKFRMLVLQAMHGLSLAQTEYLVADRLSWMRFCGLGPGDAVPDANTLWDFREALIGAGALDALFSRLDRAITEAGYLPMAGQILDPTLVAAPRQRNTEEEKARIKAGETADAIWPDKPARARQKDMDARWTVKFAKAKPAADGTPRIDIAIPAFGYKSHISIDRRHGVIRRAKVTDAAAHDGARLREGLIDPNNTASDIWADSAYRSAANERFLAGIGKVSRIHRRKPKAKPMPKRTARANAAKSAVRAHVEHPFAHQKGPMGLVIRTIGIARATATVTLANMAYNMKRWCWLDRRSAPA